MMTISFKDYLHITEATASEQMAAIDGMIAQVEQRLSLSQTRAQNEQKPFRAQLENLQRKKALLAKQAEVEAKAETKTTAQQTNQTTTPGTTGAATPGGGTR